MFEEIFISRKSFTRGWTKTRRTRDYNTSLPSGEIPFKGELRLIGPTHWILVDIGGGGGINHLMHCWKCLVENRGKVFPKISLFYVFLAPSKGIGERYRALWDFVKGKADAECGMRLQAIFVSIERPRLFKQPLETMQSRIKRVREEMRARGIFASFDAILSDGLGQKKKTLLITDLEIDPQDEIRLKFNQNSS